MKQFLWALAFVFTLVMLLLYFLQRHLIYFPAKQMPSRQHFHAQGMEDVKLVTSDGLHLNAWYQKATPGKPTILYLHGNAGHIGFRMPLVSGFLNAGYGVLLLEYRGYGGNPGSPSELGLYRDGEAAMTFLLNEGVPSEAVILYGESLGSGIATKLAEQTRFCAVILQSPYTSMAEVARFHYPWILLPPWDKFDSLSRIDRINAPLLILHGRLDRLVPFEQAQVLYKKAKEPKKLIEFADKDHNNLWDKDFFAQLMQFIHLHCSKND
ncbi:alpha/beta hydrolase [Legionella erythra]|uniref:Alpha/beta superfamily hydrolase n=1 Tax=Legionella erythra TaxID=448 RepID=A0A0W0TG34_LEGER|nr:alpha/beta hydrolase [Legionella erythra]KTC94542.1 alpha/beta superfamily hydrolase [Legionella erythra]